jgi:hypothetical protein
MNNFDIGRSANKHINVGRLCCVLEPLTGNLFFSLVDYRNNYFTSDNPNKIIEFYKGFENRDQLIQWMRERPKGVANVHEVFGDNDIIMVIPTADFNGKYSKECRENIFKGLHMVFVESGGRGDFYFNIAHNINVGIRKAMEYNPKWIIFSGDDVFKIDEVAILVNNLKHLSNDKIDVVFTGRSLYHSIPKLIIERNYFTDFINIFRHGILGKSINKLYRKYDVKILISEDRFVQRLLFKVTKYIDFVNFAIFSYKFVMQKGINLYDETFINEGEDSDLSLEIHYNSRRIGRIDFKIGDYIGMSLGTGMDRKMRAVAGLTYLNCKWDKTVLSNSSK